MLFNTGNPFYSRTFYVPICLFTLPELVKNSCFPVLSGLFICKFSNRGPKWRNLSSTNNKGNMYIWCVTYLLSDKFYSWSKFWRWKRRSFFFGQFFFAASFFAFQMKFVFKLDLPPQLRSLFPSVSNSILFFGVSTPLANKWSPEIKKKIIC